MNNDLANEIRSKTDIVDIIGERIPLVARGKNFFGVCPFHDDSNPSLCVSREKQIYTCFSCHATGNVYTFLMNYEHIDFREALRYLGEKVGVNVSGVNIKKKTTKYDKLYEAYNFAVKYFQNNLSSIVGGTAKEYLHKRGIDDKTIKEFEIGLSLEERDDLTRLLIKKDYDLATLNRIGLSSDNHDIYNDRIMFPLYDVSGQVVGFSGRVYKDNGQNKYLNTKETEIFKKGEMLYHYHIAREECRLKKYVIVMEGFMDVIRASTVGIKNTVALMGTALTKEQINLIKRLSNNIIICLDGDDPGVKAALSVGEAFLNEGLEVKIVSLPKEDDPDTYILHNGGDKFLGLVENALNYSDFKMNSLRSDFDFRSDEEKANYINTVLKETAKISDPIRIEIILKRLAKEFDIEYNTLEKRFRDIVQFREIKNEKQIVVPKKEKIKRKTKYEKASEQVLYFMLNNDWVISQVEKDRVVFPNEEGRVLASEITYYYQLYGKINVADFYTYVQDKESVLVLLNSILGENYSEETTKEELFKYFNVIKDYRRSQEIKRLTKLMSEEVDPIEQAKIGNKIMKLRMGE